MKFTIIIFLVFILKLTSYCQPYKLINEPSYLPAFCGYVENAGEFLFLNEKDSTNIIGVITCLGYYGNNFFNRDSLYTIEIANYSGDISKDTIFAKSCTIINVLKNPKNIPIKLINRIKIFTKKSD